MNGIAAVLYQETTDKRHQIISYASAKLNDAQQCWHTNEQECYAALWAMKRYRAYLDHQQFTLCTDSRALIWLNRAREEKSKFMHWSLQMQEFNYNVEHVRGTENHLADALSRTPHGPAIDEESIADLPSYTTLSAINVTTAIEAIIKSAQDADSAIQTIMQQMQAGSLANGWKVIDNYLYRDTTKGPKLLVPTSPVSDVLIYFHNDTLAGHPGILETIRAASNGFYWPTL